MTRGLFTQDESDRSGGRAVPVAFFLPHLDAGGIERVVLNLLLNLDRQRFAPHLILRSRRGMLLPHVPSDVPIFDLGGRSARAAIPRLSAALRGTRARVAYSGTNAANLAILGASRYMHRAPAIVVSEHTQPREYLEEAKWRRLRLAAMRWLYPKSSAVAVPAEELGIELRQILNRPNLPIVHLPNPLIGNQAIEFDDEPPPLMRKFHGPVFVSAGRLAHAKAFDVLCKAFALLRQRHPDAGLIILGEGSERPSLTALVQSLGQEGHIALPGTVENPSLYFRHAQATVLSSRREGFGNVLIEAMAAGSPVIATDCSPGPRAIVLGGMAGLLIPPEDASALADGMVRLIEDSNLRKALAAGGSARAADFEIRKTMPAFQALFERLGSERTD
jgi:glycosyltransferase involved in cell wall biosynthesis